MLEQYEDDGEQIIIDVFLPSNMNELTYLNVYNHNVIRNNIRLTMDTHEICKGIEGAILVELGDNKMYYTAYSEVLDMTLNCLYYP